METQTLEEFVSAAAAQGASDLHLEPDLPPAVRVQGRLLTQGSPIDGQLLLGLARRLIGEESWNEFVQRRSFDGSRRIAGVRCRVNVFQSSRGIGFAIRLLSSFEATLQTLNLHPSLKELVQLPHGLILVSGPTGSGKSSTMAALIQELNQAEARHVLTLESPIEYVFRPKNAFIRQREVGRDTPSFEQGLLDSLREDPDVLMVGEMRDPETMRLTLSAAETGHLVLATVHSSSCVEALQRVIGAFPADIQNSIAAQVADCLVGVVCQRLRYRADLNITLPELEILRPTNPVKAHIRSRDFFKISSVMETGAEAGMWTFARYQAWMAKKSDWHVPKAGSPAVEVSEERPGLVKLPPLRSDVPKAPRKTPERASNDSGGRIEIEPVAGGLDDVLKELQ
ncbi:PilT/PilU family type 4a pilus ATPase [bacterium]|nr:PilT/PilU family type 4a pilus ATPase [bacterium]